MPYYDYVCESCQHSFEAFQSMSDEALRDCPGCKQSSLRRVIGNSGVIFKGSGFYVTDSKKPACGGGSGCQGSCDSKAG